MREKAVASAGDAGLPAINLISIAQALLVAEHLSIRRAAGVLGVRQSAVSRRIRSLEDALGVSLFERYHGGGELATTLTVRDKWQTKALEQSWSIHLGFLTRKLFLQPKDRAYGDPQDGAWEARSSSRFKRTSEGERLSA